MILKLSSVFFFLLRYSSTQKRYKCYHPLTKRTYVKTDVTFIENQAYFGDTYLQGESKLREDRWWESNQPPPIPSEVYKPLLSATSNPSTNYGPAINDDLNLPIVIRKGVRSYAHCPIYQFVTFQLLSP